MADVADESHEGDGRRTKINPRIVGLIVVLIVGICAAVIVTDLLSPRDRNLYNATAPATAAHLPR